MYVQFKTCSPDLSVKILYRFSYMGTWNFASSGLSGLDLYAWENSSSSWRFVATTKNITYPTSVSSMMASRGKVPTRYRLHLPLYNGVRELYIGHDDSCPLEPDAETRKKIVWYGTSIAQGASASRPGMAFTNAIALRSPYQILNFGFSSNCLMEMSVAQYLVQIPNPSLFVIDCNANMEHQAISQKTEPLVRFLREHHPSVPIVLAEDTLQGAAWLELWPREMQNMKRKALRGAYDALVQAGDPNLHYVYREQLFDFSSKIDKLLSPTVDRIHPTDLGMQAITDFYIKFLPTVLSESMPTAYQTQLGRMPLHEAVEVGDWFFDTYSTHQTGSQPESSSPILYTDILEVGIMGRAFGDAPCNRLPARAKASVRDVIWQSSLHSTGLFVAFETDAEEISFNYGLDSDSSSLWHTPMTATSGVDLYRFDEASGVWGWVSTLHTFPKQGEPQFGIFSSYLPQTGRPSQYLLFLSLRKEVRWGFIGVRKGTSKPRRNSVFSDDGVTINGKKPILWYGTTATLVGAVSRVGRIFTNILTRNLGRVVLNMGFAGDGSMEINETEILSEIDSELFVLECSQALVMSNLGTVVRLYRERRPYTPIVLVDMDGFFSSRKQPLNSTLTIEYENLLSEGYKDLHLVQRSTHHELYNPTVDGVEPTDVGHWEIATFFTQYLDKILSMITSTTSTMTGTSRTSRTTTSSITVDFNSSSTSSSTTTSTMFTSYKAAFNQNTTTHHFPQQLPTSRPPRLPSSTQVLSINTMTTQSSHMPGTETTTMTSQLTQRPPPPRLPRVSMQNEVTFTTTFNVIKVVQGSIEPSPTHIESLTHVLRQNSSNDGNDSNIVHAEVMPATSKVPCENCNGTMEQGSQMPTLSSTEIVFGMEQESKSRALGGVIIAASSIIFSLSW
eukprot:TRINITY_DN15738_c0_g2_i1.p1 TRINITY_DN15738_c0_g2~~TRINITY_DN15738_c0_g2_i1.p1  ORF type:complete len:991 (-),score=124.62 TRINITY_DN15738_c0_g2_i1:400-3099(-)